MKKNIFLIIAILLAIIAIISYEFFNYQISLRDIKNNNKTYESFYNTTVLGTDIASLINKIDDVNQKNKIQKDNNGLYVEDEKESIIIEIKLKEIDKSIRAEKIEQNEISKFVQNFGAESFKCTKIEYHKQTSAVKYMYFEQL